MRAYFLISYLLMLLNTGAFLRFINWDEGNWVTALFCICCWLVYSILYLAPAAIITGIASLSKKKGVLYATAVMTVALSQIAVGADAKLFAMYDFHFNGFVWNLITTPGGIESMGATMGTQVTVACLVVMVFAVHALLLWALCKLPKFTALIECLASKRFLVGYGVAFIVLFLVQFFLYGSAHFFQKAPILVAAEKFPFFQQVKMRSLFRSLGYEQPMQSEVQIQTPKNLSLFYPIKAIEREEHKKYNIVWLTGESWRFDMLSPEIMPKTYAFSKTAVNFSNHYSGGNGTRMGMFSMFYGIYANYWHAFINEKRGPVLMDWLIEDNYQFGMYTSARFTYPEFDKTMFLRIPPEAMYEGNKEPSGCENDEENIARVIEFIKKRDKNRPFMTFMFFESTHAPYSFFERDAIRKPYLEDLNYIKMDPEKEIDEIKNRYINASRSLDENIGTLLEYLRKEQLLENTIIIINGDHGEEFMEKGRYGHNSTFSEEQVRTPMIIWYPGVHAAVVNRMTSHLDIPATLGRFLGVKNPSNDYSHGYDLLGDFVREYTVIADWDGIGFVDDEYKGSLPLKTSSFGKQRITTKDDKPADKDVFYKKKKSELFEIINELGRFNKN